MRAPTGTLFSFSKRSSSNAKPYGSEQPVQIVSHALIQPIQLRALLGLKRGIARGRLEQTGGEGGINPFEQLQEYQADGVPLRGEPVAPRMRDFLHQILGAEFG